MRLTLRCIIATMRAVEQALDEVTNHARNNVTAYYADLRAVSKQMRETRAHLHEVIDRMIDTGDTE